MSVLTNVAKVVILGVGNVLCGIGKDLIETFGRQGHLVSVENDTGFAEFMRRLEILLWLSWWVNDWSDCSPIFFSEQLTPASGNRVLKVYVWIS